MMDVDQPKVRTDDGDLRYVQPVQQNQLSKWKWISTGTMEIDPKMIEICHPGDIRY